MKNFIRITLTFTILLLSIVLINYLIFYFNISNENKINFLAKFDSNYLKIYFTPLIYAISLIIMFLVEYIILGWKNSSLKSILNISNPTCRVDIFYIWVKLSGIMNVCFNLFFFGFGFFFLKQIENISLFKIDNIFLQFSTAIIMISFIEYVYHRICHNKFFWELHKIHHAAEEMNIFTASREHPIVVSITIILISIPIALFGVDPYIAITCKMLLGGYNLMLHSKVYILPNFFKIFFITTKDHHVHHSTLSEHFNRNFGNLFNFWDKFFGTYYDSSKLDKIEIGIDDKNYNNKNSLKQIFVSVYLWFGNLKKIVFSNHSLN